jgi:hypothetical protein
VLVSYADPNVGHLGFVYRAASWLYMGQTEDGRYYTDANGRVIARRSFHSGSKIFNKAQILSMGYQELKKPGKHRYVRPISKRSKRLLTTACTRLALMPDAISKAPIIRASG